MTAELRLILTWAATVALLLIVDCFGPLSRLLFERPGDGTRFVLPPAYIAGTVTVEMLMLSALNLFGDILEGMLPRADLIACRVYAELKRYRSSHSEFSAKVARTGSGIVAFPLLVVLALFLNTYVIVTDRGVVVNEFFQMHPRSYRWDQIRAVDTEVKFNDGRTWIPDTTCRGTDPNTDALRFVAARWGEQRPTRR